MNLFYLSFKQTLSLIVMVMGLTCIGATKKNGNPWVKIQGDAFEMGGHYCRDNQGNTDWCSDEVVHSVRLNSFAIHMYEVTNHDYYDCFRAGKCSPNELHDTRPRDFSGRNQPVVFVSWKQAVDYCLWIGGRLPSEAEWEFAAKTRRLGGAHFGQKYNIGSSQSVGMLQPNSNGLHDMLGNVYEWVQDWYEPYEVESTQNNPKGPETGKDKVVRGGAWNSPSVYLRASDRVARSPELRYSDVGFRCVKTNL